MNTLCNDWMRYADNAWMLWTDKPLTQLTGAIRTILNAADGVLALSINPHDTPAGAMPPWVWTWFNRYRDQHTGLVNWPTSALPLAPETTDWYAAFGLPVPALPTTSELSALNPPPNNALASALNHWGKNRT
jgi:hypothetical protein